MMKKNTVLSLRKLSQQYAYTSLQMHENMARQAGFSATDHKYLGFFLQKGSLTAGELAGLSGLTTGAVTGLIDRFEQKKLIQRQADPNDRRKVVLVPDTKNISKLLATYYQDFQQKTDELIATFSEEERAIISSYMEKAIHLMQHTHQKPQL